MATWPVYTLAPLVALAMLALCEATTPYARFRASLGLGLGQHPRRDRSQDISSSSSRMHRVLLPTSPIAGRGRGGRRGGSGGGSQGASSASSTELGLRPACSIADLHGDATSTAYGTLAGHSVRGRGV